MKEWKEANWGQITVQSVATLLRKANSKRKELVFTNSSSTTLFVGTNTEVTTDSGDNPGYEVLPQGSFYGSYKGTLYGIIDSGTITITFWEEDED